jgi:hypothetical protein
MYIHVDGIKVNYFIPCVQPSVAGSSEQIQRGWTLSPGDIFSLYTGGFVDGVKFTELF